MMHIKELFVENGDGNKLSMGRIMAWIVFVVMIVWWFAKTGDIPENMLYVFGFLMSYNFGKKVRDLGNNYVDIISTRAGKTAEKLED